MANEQKPIAEVSLPSHHPIVQSCKPGEHCTAQLRRAKDISPPMGMKDADADDQPPSLTTRFHVMSLKKGKAAAPAPGEPDADDETPLDRVRQNRMKEPSPTPPPAR